MLTTFFLPAEMAERNPCAQDYFTSRGREPDRIAEQEMEWRRRKEEKEKERQRAKAERERRRREAEVERNPRPPYNLTAD